MVVLCLCLGVYLEREFLVANLQDSRSALFALWKEIKTLKMTTFSKIKAVFDRKEILSTGSGELEYRCCAQQPSFRETTKVTVGSLNADSGPTIWQRSVFDGENRYSSSSLESKVYRTRGPKSISVPIPHPAFLASWETSGDIELAGPVELMGREVYVVRFISANVDDTRNPFLASFPQWRKWGFECQYCAKSGIPVIFRSGPQGSDEGVLSTYELKTLGRIEPQSGYRFRKSSKIVVEDVEG